MFKFLTVLIHIINLLTIVYMVFKEKRSANSIIAWTLILYIAPFISAKFVIESSCVETGFMKSGWAKRICPFTEILGRR